MYRQPCTGSSPWSTTFAGCRAGSWCTTAAASRSTARSISCVASRTCGRFRPAPGARLNASLTRLAGTTCSAANLIRQRGCHVELIMKDISTVRYHLSGCGNGRRLRWRWPRSLRAELRYDSRQVDVPEVRSRHEHVRDSGTGGGRPSAETQLLLQFNAESGRQKIHRAGAQWQPRFRRSVPPPHVTFACVEAGVLRHIVDARIALVDGMALGLQLDQ